MNTIPIEFMAWDKKDKKLIFGSLLLMNDRAYIYDRDSGDLDDIDFGYGFEEVDIDSVMQLTALRSINNEPIYNHMIVKDEYGDLHLVDMLDYTKMFYISLEKLEIVGNRFQHPELLELCK